MYSLCLSLWRYNVDFDLCRLKMFCTTWPSCRVCWRSWSSYGEVSRRLWNTTVRLRSTRLPSLAMSCPNISPPFRYISLHVMCCVVFFLLVKCILHLSYVFDCKSCWFVFVGWAMHCCTHTVGLIFAPKFSSNIQVSVNALFVFLMLFVTICLHTVFVFHFFVNFYTHPAFSLLLTFLSKLFPSCGVLSRLRKMESGAVPTQYGQLLECICSWGQAAHILELITEWLTEALPKQGVSLCNKKPNNFGLDLKGWTCYLVFVLVNSPSCHPQDKTNSSRKVRIQETTEAKPDLALAYLEYVFSHTSLREKVLALGPGPMKQLHTVLGNWKVSQM